MMDGNQRAICPSCGRDLGNREPHRPDCSAAHSYDHNCGCDKCHMARLRADATVEQPWQHLVWVEANSLINRAEQARQFGKPEAAAALEWCANAALEKAFKQ